MTDLWTNIYGDPHDNWLMIMGSYEYDAMPEIPIVGPHGVTVARLLGSPLNCLQDVYEWMSKSSPYVLQKANFRTPVVEPMARYLGVNRSTLTGWLSETNVFRLDRISPSTTRRLVTLVRMASDWRDLDSETRG